MQGNNGRVLMKSRGGRCMKRRGKTLNVAVTISPVSVDITILYRPLKQDTLLDNYTMG